MTGARSAPGRDGASGLWTRACRPNISDAALRTVDSLLTTVDATAAASDMAVDAKAAGARAGGVEGAVAVAGAGSVTTAGCSSRYGGASGSGPSGGLTFR